MTSMGPQSGRNLSKFSISFLLAFSNFKTKDFEMSFWNFEAVASANFGTNDCVFFRSDSEVGNNTMICLFMLYPPMHVDHKKGFSNIFLNA